MDRIYRKLQKIGGSLVISLPKKWTENYDLKAGASIAIDVRDDGTLTIMPKMQQSSDELIEEIVLEADQYVIWELLKKSLAGLTNIVITSDKEINKILRKNIRRYVNRLPNTEVIEETNHRMTIQNFGYKEIPTKKLIQRLLYLVANMFEDLRNGAMDDLHDNFEHLRKFYFILVIHIRTYLRTGVYISTTSDFTPLEALDYRMLCEKNQEIGEILENFTPTEGISGFYKETEQYFTEIMEAFLNKDDKLAYYSWLKKDGLFRKAKKLMEKLEHDDRDNLNILLRIVQNCKDMAALI
ncbi:MAG: AbrB/MazE/SpoVT family DNA-binding domain-containing protein [Promethearchaeota archaeon]